MVQELKCYLQLTKPTIVLLVAITALGALASQGILFEHPFHAFLITLAISMAAGSANAFNQVLDRDIDRIMPRTRAKRPLPSGRLTPTQAALFAAFLGVSSSAYLWFFWSPLAAGLSAATIFFYTVIYTMFLKRRHHYNIVIGGAAGAAGPIIAWAAVEGHVSLFAWILFMLIFMWTPAHFWALALAIKDEYQSVHVPMLPVTHGEKRTRIEIVAYTISLLPLSLLPLLLDDVSWFYGGSAFALWLWYALKTKQHFQNSDKKKYMKLFYISIVYLFFLFVAVGIDGAIKYLSL